MLQFELRRALLEAKAAIAIWRAEFALKRYDPNQPRVPSGRSTGGQWIEGGTIAMGGRLSEAECDLQLKTDTFHCNMVGLASCHQQAMFRYADCLTGKTIRPLSY